MSGAGCSGPTFKSIGSWRFKKETTHPMDQRTRLLALGFVHAGAIRPDESGRGCVLDLAVDIPGHSVFGFVVGDQVMFIGSTGTGLKKRIAGAASALRSVMRILSGTERTAFNAWLLTLSRRMRTSK